MATIGTFTAADNGYTGSVKTGKAIEAQPPLGL
jgi:hypothetical protein